MGELPCLRRLNKLKKTIVEVVVVKIIVEYPNSVPLIEKAVKK